MTPSIYPFLLGAGFTAGFILHTAREWYNGREWPLDYTRRDRLAYFLKHIRWIELLGTVLVGGAAGHLLWYGIRGTLMQIWSVVPV